MPVCVAWEAQVQFNMQATPDRSYKYTFLGTLWAFVGVRAYSFGYPRAWEISDFKSLLKEATFIPRIRSTRNRNVQVLAGRESGHQPSWLPTNSLSPYLTVKPHWASYHLADMTESEPVIEMSSTALQPGVRFSSYSYSRATSFRASTEYHEQQDIQTGTGSMLDWQATGPPTLQTPPSHTPCPYLVLQHHTESNIMSDRPSLVSWSYSSVVAIHKLVSIRINPHTYIDTYIPENTKLNGSSWKPWPVPTPSPPPRTAPEVRRAQPLHASYCDPQAPPRVCHTHSGGSSIPAPGPSVNSVPK